MRVSRRKTHKPSQCNCALLRVLTPQRSTAAYFIKLRVRNCCQLSVVTRFEWGTRPSHTCSLTHQYTRRNQDAPISKSFSHFCVLPKPSVEDARTSDTTVVATFCKRGVLCGQSTNGQRWLGKLLLSFCRLWFIGKGQLRNSRKYYLSDNLCTDINCCCTSAMRSDTFC